MPPPGTGGSRRYQRVAAVYTRVRVKRMRFMARIVAPAAAAAAAEEGGGDRCAAKTEGRTGRKRGGKG